MVPAPPGVVPEDRARSKNRKQLGVTPKENIPQNKTIEYNFNYTVAIF